MRHFAPGGAFDFEGTYVPFDVLYSLEMVLLWISPYLIAGSVMLLVMCTLMWMLTRWSEYMPVVDQPRAHEFIAGPPDLIAA